ncbi:MAG: transcription termination/antitermination protein NusA [Oscillospiraceae bacterium]|nr:transcription termination/antitermination protein NusA [Oscillospiraceae bacterium]
MKNAEFFDAIQAIEDEKGISKEYMLGKICQALVSAYRRDNEGVADNIHVEADEVKKEINMFIRKEVVDNDAEIENSALQMPLDAAVKINPNAMVGDFVDIAVETKNFGRIAAQTAKQVIIQGIREAERSMVYDEFTSREHEILTGTVNRQDPRSGGVFVSVGSGSEKSEALMLPGEQIPGEKLTEGCLTKVYVTEVKKTTHGPQVMVSRTHPGLVKKLFEIEVPEVSDGTVEIRSIAREAGSRTKIAVWSNDESVDAVGACVGPKGGRVGAVVDELCGEKVDIVKFSEDPEEYVAAALSPADVIAVHLLPEGRACRVIVPDDQLSLAIGKEGQNARLAARLTGFKIDIKTTNNLTL